MHIFRIESQNVAYDEDISMVILAENEDKALHLAIKNWSTRKNKEELELFVEKIDLSVERIVDISHFGE